MEEKIKNLNLSERELRILAIVFCSAMEHDWNIWFDEPDGMTGETQEDCFKLSNKLSFVFKTLGKDGLQKLLNP